MTHTMTPKGFLAKVKTKAANAPLAFLEAHREFLITGQLALETMPILVCLERKEVLPTPALKEITSIVFSHMMAENLIKAQESLDRASNPSSNPREDKAYTVTIFTADGKVAQHDETDLIKGFDMSQVAERWTDLRLIENPGSRAEIAWKGSTTLTLVARDDAFARVFKTRPMASHKRTGVSMAKLGFGVKASQTRSHFSHG